MAKSITREFRRTVREEMRKSGRHVGCPLVVPQLGIRDEEGRIHLAVRAD